MKVSAVHSPVVKAKAEELKKSNEKSAEAAKAREANPNDRKKDLVRVEARNVRQVVQQKRLADKAKLEAKKSEIKTEPKTEPKIEAAPAYVVAVTKKEIPEEELAAREHRGYSPTEIKVKSKQLLESGALPPEQHKVLADILSKDQEK